jgi:transposase
LPVSEGVGHPWNPHRPIVNGIVWRLRTGCQWRDIPERYGPWQTIDDRYGRWRRDGTWDRIFQALQVKLDEHGKLDWEQWSLDSTSIRAHRAAAGARKKRGATRRSPTITP